MLSMDILAKDAAFTVEELEERLQRAGLTLREYDDALDTVILYRAAAEAAPHKEREELLARLESIEQVQRIIAALGAD